MGDFKSRLDNIIYKFCEVSQFERHMSDRRGQKIPVRIRKNKTAYKTVRYMNNTN